MIKVTFKIDGREVNPDRVGDALEKAVLKTVTENIIKKLSSVYCSVHRLHPEVIVKGKTLNKLNFEIHGCCQELIERATRKLKS